MCVWGGGGGGVVLFRMFFSSFRISCQTSVMSRSLAKLCCILDKRGPASVTYYIFYIQYASDVKFRWVSI